MQCEGLRILPFPAHVKTASTDEDKVVSLNNGKGKFATVHVINVYGGAEL
jgi:hypothetical protein